MAGVPESLRTALHGRYDPQRELGRGGMAAVYLARDLRFNRPVAIKVLASELAASVGRERFLREIQLTAQLNHPHILPLLDSGEADGLLYYVMPHVDGESLKDRIDREKQLPVRDAVAITRDVAAALGHAHAHGFIHRDIKPGNIMLSGGSAVVMDFGIARAIRHAATDDTLTDVSLAIGTPSYMSPEQWSGNRELDARTDVYSLGCVVYEMLAGHPPFTGSTTEAIAARVALDPVPPLRTVRPRVSPALERVVLRALEKVPADRYQTVADLAEALAAAPLEEVTEPAPAPPLPPLLRWAYALAGGVILAATGWFLVRPLIADGPVELDTTRYVVLPFEYRDNAPSRQEDERLRDALGWWTGLTIVEPFRVRDALSKRGRSVVSTSGARRIAKDLGAGRFVRGVVSPVGDSVRVYAGLYDSRDTTLLHDGAVMVSAAFERPASTFDRLADLLLLGELQAGARVAGATRSLPARQSFARGEDAVQAWDLAAADSAFSLATNLDRGYAQAHLWVAMVRAFSGADPTQWRIAGEQAALGRNRLSARDRGLADAILAQIRGNHGSACTAWQQLTGDHPLDYTAWYGSARCQASDSVVVHDRKSPTRWSFRSSYHRSLLAYQRAFELNPSILDSYRSSSFDPLLRLFYTRGNLQRSGKALSPDTTTFLSDLSWEGDSLAFVPRRRDAITSWRLTTSAVALDEAVQQQRERFYDVARTWAAALPQNSAAKEALAIALTMLSDPGAIDTLRSARRLTRERSQSLLIACREVWTLIAFGLPFNDQRLRRARALADSLLRDEPPDQTTAPRALAALATLTGRASLAAAYMRNPRMGEQWLEMSPRLRATAPALLAFAALGGPTDSLIVLERELRSLVEHGLPPNQRDRAIDEWLVRAATLAFSIHRFEALPELANRDNYLLETELALAAGDTLGVRRRLMELRRIRQPLSPATLTLDGLYPEAELLVAIGEPRLAIEWLDPTILALPQGNSEGFKDPVGAAALMRALALRARLAEQTGDHLGATQWAAAVATLWSNADPFLQPAVASARALARRQ